MLLIVHHILAGVCLYAAIHHFWIGVHRPRQLEHLTFGLMSLLVTFYVLAKTGAYEAGHPEELIDLRRLEAIFAVLAIGVLPWFVVAYLEIRVRLPLLILGLFGTVVAVAAAALPFGLVYTDMPVLQHYVLPWGEVVADLRVREKSFWYLLAWTYMVCSFGMCAFFVVTKLRGGDRTHTRAPALAAALAVFFVFILFNQVVNSGAVAFVHTAEYGFISLVLLMSAAMTHQLRTGASELLASEERFRTLADQAADAIFLHDVQGRLVDANRQACSMLGYSRDELLKLSVADLEVDVKPEQAHKIWNALRPGEPVNVEGRHRRKDGSTFPVEVRVGLFSKGNDKYALAIARDITDRLHAEEALRQNEKTFRATIDAVAEGIVMQNASDEILVCNAAAERILGLTAGQMMGLSSQSPNWRAMREDGSPFPAQEHPAVRARITGKPVSDQVMGVHRPDGTLVWIEINSRPIIGVDGQVEATVTSFSDISARRAAEHALWEAQRLGRMGSWELNLETGKVLWSDETYRIFEIDPVQEAPSFEAYLQLIHPDDRERLTKAYQASLENQTPYEIDHRLQFPDGRIKYLSCKGESEFRDGKPVRTWGMAHDVTDMWLKEEEIRQLNATLEQRVRERTAELQAANKELESFSYSVSHDLRAPLRAIDGFSRILHEEYGDKLDDAAKDSLERVRAAAQRMGSLIDALLSLARVTRVPFRREEIDLTQLAREVAEELRRSESDRKVEFVLGSGVSCVGDPSLLRVLLLNLLGNAWKYTRNTEYARIEFGKTDKDGLASFFVKDNGSGFDMQYADKLFAPFQRLHSAQEFEGTGIGLATVARIAHRHGGHVWTEAELGKGATFYFTLSDAR